jgi:hypothetical protein
MHGGKSTGRPAISGYFTKEAILERELLNESIKALGLLCREIEQ